MEPKSPVSRRSPWFSQATRSPVAPMSTSIRPCISAPLTCSPSPTPTAQSVGSALPRRRPPRSTHTSSLPSDMEPGCVRGEGDPYHDQLTTHYCCLCLTHLRAFPDLRSRTCTWCSPTSFVASDWNIPAERAWPRCTTRCSSQIDRLECNLGTGRRLEV